MAGAGFLRARRISNFALKRSAGERAFIKKIAERSVIATRGAHGHLFFGPCVLADTHQTKAI
jgi:hypothetical protein